MPFITQVTLPKDGTGEVVIPNRFQSLFNTTTLGANGVYTQPWIDSTATGFVYPQNNGFFLPGTSGPTDVNFVSGSVYTDQNGTLYIDMTDDTTNSNNVVSASFPVVGGTTPTQIPLMQITSRYYRFRYVNGSTPQTTFTLSQVSERIDALAAGRPTQYQRILVNQAITASQSIHLVLPVGLGTKSLNATFSTTGTAQLVIYPCDVNGNALTGSSIGASTTTVTSGSAIVQEIGGMPYVGIYVSDKSAAANTCNFVDVWWTKS